MKEDFSSVRSLPQNHLNEVTLCPICFSDQIVVFILKNPVPVELNGFKSKQFLKIICCFAFLRCLH